MQNFNYHSHTYRCGHADLDYKDEDYIIEYIKMGFQKIAFTDHCPQKNEIDKRPYMRMKYNDRNEYLSTIEALKEKYADKIEIQTGYEVEYLPGEEENIIELKNESDKIILGQHFVYSDNHELKFIRRQPISDEDLITYAEYIEKAMELNIPDIVAHPDLFMLGRENFGEIENKVANMICETAEKYNIPLEINLSNIFERVFYENKVLNPLPFDKQKEKLTNVSYPSREFWNIAAKYNIKVVYGIDTHHKGQILLWNELIELAKEIIGEETIQKLNFVEE